MNSETIQIDVPKALLAAALLEKIARQDLPAVQVELVAPAQRALPAIGAAFEGGLYAGLTLHEGRPHALVLLPGDESKDWKAAGAWAAEQGGILPSRIDLLVLWQNLPKEFREEYYWSSETYARYADYAWNQSFDYGYQVDVRKSDDGRCRAVRRVAI